MENDAARYAQEEMRPRFQRLAKRHEEGTAPRAVVAFQLFQTPPEVAAMLAARLDLSEGARVLEPSAGLGRIIDALEPFKPSEVVAVEVAAACAGELFRQNRDRVTIKQRDFLAVSPSDLGTFDAVAMNPPFHMRADVRHILHARQFLKPGGRLAALCLAGAHRERDLRPHCNTWEPLPPGLFKKEGTGVGVILLTMNALWPCLPTSPATH